MREWAREGVVKGVGVGKGEGEGKGEGGTREGARARIWVRTSVSMRSRTWALARAGAKA